MSKELVFETANKEGLKALDPEVFLQLRDIISHIVINADVILVAFAENERDVTIWWNKFYKYYSAFIKYMKDNGMSNLLKTPAVMLDIKGGHALIIYRRTPAINNISIERFGVRDFSDIQGYTYRFTNG